MNNQKENEIFQRLKLVFKACDYIQPLCYENGHGISMIFVSYPKVLTKKEYHYIVNKTNKKVYNKTQTKKL